MTTLNSDTLNPIKTDALSLRFEDGIAFMKLSGKVGTDDLGEALEWLTEANDAHDSYNMCVDVAKMDFSDLGEISSEFKRLAAMWRTAKALEKCAVVTDSKYLQSAAKIEGAVIPGLEIESFEMEELAPAMTWLGAGPEPSKPAVPKKDPMKIDLAAMYG